MRVSVQQKKYRREISCCFEGASLFVRSFMCLRQSKEQTHHIFVIGKFSRILLGLFVIVVVVLGVKLSFVSNIVGAIAPISLICCVFSTQ